MEATAARRHNDGCVLCHENMKEEKALVEPPAEVQHVMSRQRLDNILVLDDTDSDMLQWLDPNSFG
jgi:hypothetical protein